MVDYNILMRFKNFEGEKSFDVKKDILSLDKDAIDKIIKDKKKKYYFEWTDHKEMFKPYYDIDFKFTNYKEFMKHVDNILTNASDTLSKLYPDGELAISKSHGFKTVKKKFIYALSFHIAVNGYETDIPSLKKFNENNNLYNIKYEDDDYKPYDKKDNKIFDNSVYRDGGNMRMIYSYKPNDKRKLIPVNFEDDYTKHLIQSNNLTNEDPEKLKLKSPPISPVASSEEKEDDDFIVIDEDKDVFGVIKEEKKKYIVPTLKELKDVLFLINNRYEYEEWVSTGLCISNIAKLSKDEMYIKVCKKYFHEWSKLDNSGKYNKDEVNTMWNCWIKRDIINKPCMYGSLKKWASQRDMPIEYMNMEQIFLKEVWKGVDRDNDPPNIEQGINKMLEEMNNRVIYVKETSDFIALDRRIKYKYGINERGEDIVIGEEKINCWSIKSTKTKLIDHFSTNNFTFSYLDKTTGKIILKKYIPLNLWLEWSDRREVWSIGFDPKNKDNKDIFNLWNGFRISKEVADEYDEKLADPILKHIKELWCKNNEDDYNYILNLFAHYIQKPHIKTGVLLALKSKQGGGKGIILNKLAEIIGDVHYCQNSNAKQLFGEFNGQLEGRTLINLDEAFWGGDKEMEGRIKNKITESKQTINKKNKEAYLIDCFANYIITTNNDWFAGTTEDDRRFFCLQLADKISGRMTNETCKEIQPVLNSPSEAFAKILYNRNIKDFVPRIFKKTKLLQDQVERNWNSVYTWWNKCLVDGGFEDKRCKYGFVDWGKIPYNKFENNEQFGAHCIEGKDGKKKTAYSKGYLYEIYSNTVADGRKFSNSSFYKDIIHNCLNDLYKEVRPYKKKGSRPTYIVLPELEVARKQWNKLQQYEYNWEIDDEWTICDEGGYVDSDSD